VNGTPSADTINVNGGQVTRSGETVNFSNLEALVVNGVGGNDTITVTSPSVPTTISGGDNNDTITVNATSVAMTLNGDNHDDTITVVNASAALTIDGGNDNDTINIQ